MNSTPAQELLRHFQAFLEGSKLSTISIKNYVSDVRQFLVSSKLTSARLITQKHLQDYLTQIQKSKPAATYQRYSASLRQFVSFLALEYRINLPPLTSPKIDPSPLTTQDITNQFKTYLQNEKRSHSTIKNYVSDLNHYWAWSANNPSNPSPTAYLNHLKLSHIKSSLAHRREAALNKFEKFSIDLQGQALQVTPPLAFFNRPTVASPKSAAGKTKAGLYQRYHALPFTPYLHLALLVLFTTALGLFAYNQIIKQAKPELAYPTALTRPTRQLSFQGRLTDSSDTPIITATNLSFKLYSALTGGSALYNSGTCSVSPDTDGIFNTVIGDGTCGAEIGSNIFSENASLYLEVLVGAQTLTPRQPIATVGYALNSETLQGYPASASAVENTVPIMNNDGDIILGASSPTIQSTSDTFAIKGQAMTLSTNTATNGNISLAPDGTGGLNAIGGATTGNFLRVTDANLTSGNLISGYVGNDTATGNLLSLSSGASETTKFVVKASGNVGVGTTAPQTKLHVEGACVTGDTLIRRRRRRRRGSGEPPWEDVPVTDIEAGDEIMSMEPDGSFTVSKVRRMMNMGRKETWKLITSKGKQIRTTAKHPYFVLEKRPIEELKRLYATFEVDQSNRLEDMNVDSVVALASKESDQIVTIKISKRIKRSLKREFYAGREKQFGPEMLATLIIYAIWTLGLKVGKLVIDKEYTKYEKFISKFLYRYYPEISIWFRSVGRNTAAHQAAWGVATKQKALAESALAKSGANLVFKESLASELLHSGMPTRDSQSTRLLLPIVYQSPLALSMGDVAQAHWTQVKYLKKGMWVATADGWEVITNIYKTGVEEEVFDLEIENTHNFVANGIVAHNTTGKALTIFNETGDQNILTASQSGIPVFNLARVSGTAANGTTFTPSATGNAVTQAATGSDTNIAFSLDAKGSGALNLNGTATGDVNLAGGYGGTGCTITNSNGNLSCNGTITGTFAGTLPWSSIVAPTANLSLAHAGYTTAFTFDSVTTADAFALSSSSLTTGTVLDLSSTSTAGGASGLSKVLDITRSGTNANASHTAYGLYSAVTNTGTTSTNVGGYFSASGATNNYGLIVGAGNVGIGTTSPAATSILDLTSTTKGFLAPRMTTTQRDAISTPATGLFIYNTTTNAYNVYNGTTWGAVGGGSSSVWSDLTLPTANLSLAMAAYTSTFTYNATTGTANLFNLTDTLNNTGTGYLLNLTTASGSTLKPFHVSSAGTEALMVDAAGKVGIGSTSPSAKLTINGTTEQMRLSYDASNYWSSTVGATGGLTLAGTGAGGALTLTPTSGQNLNVSLATTGDFAVNSNQLYVDTSAGFVGIGDTTPSNKLDVNGVVAGTYFVDYSNNAYGLDPAGTANFGGYSMQITGGALLAVDLGNVGIGTATPTAKLDVGGTASVSGILSLASSIGTQAMTSMNIGNSTTGNIVIDSGSNAITLSDNVTLTTGVINSSVATGATAVGFTLNTASMTTQGAKLLSVQNASTEKFYIDKDGNLYAAGTILSGNGQGMLMTNKSGGTVAQKALVIIDTSNNSAFTTTTTAYAKTAFGVVTGVGLGVTNDANGDGVCNANDICMIAVGGEVNVTTTNASTASKGEYLFTSATAGSAVASAKQFDGLVGVVSSTANAGSGYLKMIFKVQPQVTAAASIDKGSKHNEYWLYANKYTGVGEGADVNANLLTRGLMFDNFMDSTKTDSANTTVSSPTQFSQLPASPFRAGLIGGQTLATSTTDNAGNTYLGSNTVNKTVLYDRTRDSSPQVQVELGIDPNWYNGVTLAVATTSAQFSQNTTIVKNPSLSTTYNGSLVKVTGTYTSNAKTIYITIKSPTTFDWTDYNGQAATGVTITPGTAQTLGGTGVSAKFTDARYNTGDVFKIASWFVEPASSTRGTKQQFPERSYVIATASSVDIIDADTQKLWMRFSSAASQQRYTGWNNSYPKSVSALNGQVYFGTNDATNADLRIAKFWSDSGNIANSTYWYELGGPIASRNTSLAANIISTTPILVNAFVNDVSAAVICTGNAAQPSADTLSDRCLTPKTFVGVATAGGISLINETDSSVVNASDTSAFTNIALVWNSGSATYNSSMYGAKASSTINVYTNLSALAASFATTATYSTTVNPAPAATAVAINSLQVTPGISTVDTKSNTIYVGTAAGASVIQENQATFASGSVKYYTKDYISEEMVGDIRGMWPLSANGALSMSDASVQANTLTNNGTTTAVTGVRGAAASFNGSNQSLSKTAAVSSVTNNFSIGAWINPQALSGQSMAIYNGTDTGGWGFMNENSSLKGMYGGVTSIDSGYTFPSTNKWYHVVMIRDSGTTKFYVNGVQTSGTSSSTPLSPAAAFSIGREDATAGRYFNGYVDEPFVSNTVLSASQIKHMYEVGYRALQSHATTLGGPSADGNQQLGFISTGTNTVGAVGVDYNNQFMYVGTNSTTLGAVSKIDLNSDTNIKTYNSSANVPAGGALLIDEDTKSLAVGYNLEAVGSATSGVKTMGVDNNATATSGNFIGKTVTTIESFTQAYLWAQYVTDGSDASNVVTVSASNDGGTNYYQCNLTNTDASQTPTEYEYFCQFNAAGSSLKTKFALARGSTKTNTYLTRYGIAWIGSDAIGGAPGGNGLYTNNNASVANGSFIDVVHNQNSNDLVSNAWVSNGSTWQSIDGATNNIDVYGSGLDGAVTVTASKNLNTDTIASGRTYADGIAYKVNMSAAVIPQPGSSSVITSDTPSGLAVGDEILLINLQGASGDTGDVGNYEFLRIQSINSTTVNFEHPIVKTYKGTTASNQKAVIQRIPQYTNVTLSGSGSLTASAWEALATTPTGAAGYLTGIVAFRATGTVTVGSGTSITTNALGFGGGAGGSSLAGGSTYNGTGGTGGFYLTPINGTSGQGGGGGGSGNGGNGNGTGGAGATGGAGGGGGNFGGGGGGGAGYAAVGSGGVGGTGGGGTGNSGSAGSGTSGGSGGNGNGSGGGGGGGGTYGTTALSTLYLGSGGGSGGYGDGGGAGGKGGGIVFVSASTVTVSGGITANGGNGGSPASTNNGGGGGGAGGSVFIAAATPTLGTNLVTTSAGTGGTASSGGGNGGAGGVGRIRVEYTGSLSGTTSPSASTATTLSSQVFPQNGPYVIKQQDANTARLYNYSGSTQNLRLDVITGGLGRNAGTVSLAPAAADVDSQSNVNSIWVNKTGSGGNLLKLQTSGADMTLVNNLGDITGGITTLDGSTTANGAGTASTTLILTSATNFDVGNYVKVSSTNCVTGVNVCYAKITAIATNTLTISPALTWANASAVVEVHVPEFGGINTSQALANRYGRGYFIDGIVTGNGSSYFTDNLISMGGGSKILDSSGKLQLQAGGTGTGSTGTGSIYFLDSGGTAVGRFDTTDLANISAYGSGGDGAVTISTAKNINTNTIATGRSYADGIAYRVTAPADSATSVTRYSGSDTLSNGIAAGDEVLLINLKGTSSDNADVGNYQFKKVSSATASTITFTSAITKSFDGTTASNQSVVVQRIPQYTNVTVSTGGSLTASAWDSLVTTPTGAAGYYTGIVALRATGTISVASGTSITASNLGFTLGKGWDNPTPGGGPGGETYNGTAGTHNSGTGQGGGGGGAGNGGSGGAGSTGGGGGNGGNYNGGGGGGGGYGTVGSGGSGASGGNAGVSGSGTSGGNGGAGATNAAAGGGGGGTYGQAELTQLFHGSGGGGGGGGAWGGNGGIGGGMIFIGASTVTVSGSITANGQNGGAGTATHGGGGGGSGGSIFIAGDSLTLGSGLVTASAGTGNTGSAPGGAGANGGSGRVRVEYATSLSGTTSPSASTNSSVTSAVKSPLGSQYGALHLGSTNTTSADLAEYYVTGDDSIAAGDVVTISDTKVLDDGGQEVTNQGVLRKAAKPYDSKLIGIISTNPGVLMGSIDGDTGKEDKRMLALAGRVPVKIDPDSEPIVVGDFLTSSAKPGLAQKATKAGYTVAKALEPWSPGGPATIEVFVNLGYYAGELTAEGFLNQKTASDEAVSGDLAKLGGTPNLRTNSLVSQFLNLVKGVDPTYLDPRVREDDTLVIASEAKQSIWIATSEHLLAMTKYVRENWDSLSKMNTDIIQSLWVKTGILTADTLISPVAEIDTLRIKDNLLSPLAQIDTIYSSTISAETASISGTLYAASIESPTIDLLSTNYQLLTTNYATASAILASIQDKYADYASIESGLNATVSSSPSLDTKYLILDTVVSDALMVNTSLISNSINSNDTALYLQPTANQPINLLAGLMTLSPDGQVVINGDLTVTGNLYTDKSQITNLKSQIITTNDLIIASSSPCSPVIASGSEAIYPDGSPRGYTRDDGVWVATSSATPRNDNCDATVSGTLNSNASIGTGTIASGSAEAKIENSKIKDSTYIYLTPISDTQNQVLYVKSKTSCSLQDPSSILGMTNCIPFFTVGVPATPAAEILFNYWLIQTE